MHGGLDLVKTFLTLLALVNPLGAVPFFIGFTASDTRAERRRTIRITSIAVIIVIIVAAFLGEQVISFFGISVEAFQIAGGLIMLLMAISMVNAQVGGVRQTPEESVEAQGKESIAVVPLAVPLLAGPGTISTVIVLAGRSHHLVDILGLTACAAAIGVLTFLALSAAEPLSRVLGRTGINIATRIMGLLLAALAVEFMVGGLGELLPGLKH